MLAQARLEGLTLVTHDRTFLEYDVRTIMVSELLETQLRVMRWRDVIYSRVFAPLASPVNASLLYALAYTSLMLVVAWVLYRRQWFLKV